MKYGETLRQRSIAAWSNHNIDYDEIKRFIKKRTTPGTGESVSIPGRGDEKLAEFEEELSNVFAQQHERIDLFVRSKLGEIKRRLEHAKRQLRQLSSRRTSAADHRIPIARLERYSRLENDVVKIGDEVRSLARFTSTNRTAFRKLLKKSRKWTHVEHFCAGFQSEVLDGPKSFTKLDFGPLLDDYSGTLTNIRNLYESRVKRGSNRSSDISEVTDGTSVPQRLQAALKTGSKVDFDTAIATTPLDVSGELANYFVHPEYVVELQVLLLQHLQYYASRSRHNSLARSQSRERSNGAPREGPISQQDYCMLVADDLGRFAKDEGAVTVSEREHTAGIMPQRARYFTRWTSDEDATIAWKTGPAKVKTVPLKRKHADTFFDSTSPRRRKSDVSSDGQSLATLSGQLATETSVRPLYKISSGRSRFSGISDTLDDIVLATLDTHVSIARVGEGADETTSSNFPFAVLQMRREGVGASDLLRTLDQSHLVERVRGFSLQYHALWQTHKPHNISPPFWLPILSRDIRKLPPALESRKDSLVARTSGSGSANRPSTGTNSIRGMTDETTAVEASKPSSAAAPDQLESPPLKAFRKKRRRQYPEQSDSPPQRDQKYWSEYDDPEEGQAGDDYVVYIDPNERSTLDKLFDSIGGLLSLRKRREPDADVPGTPKDDESSSEDEESALSPRGQSYGTLPPHLQATPARQHAQDTHVPLPQVTAICMVASIAILTMSLILVSTSKRKYAATVDTAIILAIVCSLIFAGVGFVALMGQRAPKSWGAVGIAAGVLLLDAICSGGLLAWMLG